MSVEFNNNTAAEVLVMLWYGAASNNIQSPYGYYSPTIQKAERYLSRTIYVDNFCGRPIRTNFKTFPVLTSYYYNDSSNIKMQKIADKISEYLPSTQLNTQKFTDCVIRSLFSNTDTITIYLHTEK